MKVRTVMLVALIGCLSAVAGEIVILQPMENAGNEKEPPRGERDLGRTMDKARQYSGRSSATTVIIDEAGPARSIDKTEKSIRDAQDYLRPGRDAATSTSADSTTIILRAAPQGEAERQRQKARSYVAPANTAHAGRDCGQAVTSVGMIGEGTGAERSVNVVEKGNSAVNVNCK